MLIDALGMCLTTGSALSRFASCATGCLFLLQEKDCKAFASQVEKGLLATVCGLRNAASQRRKTQLRASSKSTCSLYMEQCLTGSDGCASFKRRQEILARKTIAKAGSPCQSRSVASDSLQLSELKP